MVHFAEFIATNIVLMAKVKGIKIRELEQASGVSVGYFSRVKRGHKGMSIETVYRAAKKLECSMDDICDRDLPKRLRKAEIEQAIAELQKELKEGRFA